MPRMQRLRSKSGYYHVMLRGNEGKDIFLDDYDRERFIEIIYKKKQDNHFNLHAFCLMNNHLHLMLSEGIEDIAQIMKRITVSYAVNFNRKYKRTGHLFQDRFKSEVIEDERYILSLLRYIHNNPVKAGLVKSIADYRWSSHNSYLNAQDPFAVLIDNAVILSVFSQNKESAHKLYQEYMRQESDDKFIDLVEEDKGSEEKAARAKFKSMIKERGISPDSHDKIKVSDELIREFRRETGLSIRKMADIMNINKDRVNRALKS